MESVLEITRGVIENIKVEGEILYEFMNTIKRFF